jgi:hypothetical protein
VISIKAEDEHVRDSGLVERKLGPLVRCLRPKPIGETPLAATESVALPFLNGVFRLRACPDALITLFAD